MRRHINNYIFNRLYCDQPYYYIRRIKSRQKKKKKKKNEICNNQTRSWVLKTTYKTYSKIIL